jgi:hypothetical protein
VPGSTAVHAAACSARPLPNAVFILHLCASISALLQLLLHTLQRPLSFVSPAHPAFLFCCNPCIFICCLQWDSGNTWATMQPTARGQFDWTVMDRDGCTGHEVGPEDTLHTGPVTKLVRGWTCSMLWLEFAWLQLSVCRMCAACLLFTLGRHCTGEQLIV